MRTLESTDDGALPPCDRRVDTINRRAQMICEQEWNEVDGLARARAREASLSKSERFAMHCIDTSMLERQGLLRRCSLRRLELDDMLVELVALEDLPRDVSRASDPS